MKRCAIKTCRKRLFRKKPVIFSWGYVYGYCKKHRKEQKILLEKKMRNVWESITEIYLESLLHRTTYWEMNEDGNIKKIYPKEDEK